MYQLLTVSYPAVKCRQDILIIKKGKGKVIPLQARCDPEGG